MGSQLHIGLEVVKVVIDEVRNDVVLHYYLHLKDVDFVLKGFNLSKLGSLDDCDVVGIVHTFHGLSRSHLVSKQVSTNQLTVSWTSAIELYNPTLTVSIS